MEISGDEGMRSSSEDFVDARKAKIFSKEARAFPAVVRVDFPYSIRTDRQIKRPQSLLKCV